MGNSQTDDPIETTQISRKAFVAGALGAGAGLALAPRGLAAGAFSKRHFVKNPTGSLAMDISLESPSFNALSFNNQYIRWPVDQVQECLYQFNSNLNIVPLLADGMPTRVSPTTYDVKIKSGIRFHNGDPLTVDHVVATFNAARVPPAIWASHFPLLASVTARDANTVRFVFLQQYALLTEKLAVVPIMHQNYLTQSNVAMGTGPFMWSSYAQGSQIVLTANEKYRSGPPGLAQLTFRFVPDPGARLVNLLHGDTQISPETPYANLPSLAKNSNFSVVATPAPIDLVMRINWAKVPDVRVRQAMMYAMDRQRIDQVVFNGFAGVGQGPIGQPTEGWKFAKEFYASGPNLAKAESLVKAAGGSVSLTWNLVQDTNLQNMAQIVQADWAKVGINVDLQFNQLAAWNAEYGTGQAGLSTIYSMDGRGSGRGADLITLTIVGGSKFNHTSVNDKLISDWIGLAKADLNSNSRAKWYGKVTNRCCQVVAQMAPAYPRFVVVANKKLQGLPTYLYGVNELYFAPVTMKS